LLELGVLNGRKGVYDGIKSVLNGGKGVLWLHEALFCG